MSTTPKLGRPRRKRGPRGQIAEALRSARAARGWSQVEAAQDLGVVQSTYASWESGTRRPSGLSLRYLIEVWIPAALESAEGENE